MGQIAYRGNLSSATYPMTVSDGGRTVIIPGPDNNYDRRVDPTGQQLDAGIPQALYLENVMPTMNGYQSVGFYSPTSGMTVPGGSPNISQVVEVRATTVFVGPSLYDFAIQNIPLFAWSNDTFTCGRFGTNSVTFSGTAIAGVIGGVFSTAVVRGVCYLFFSSASQRDLYTVVADAGGNLTLTNVTASVLPASFFSNEDIISICGSNNYLACHNNVTAYWSSTTTPTDFTSSLVAGAGQIDPNNSDDALIYMRETLNGFYIYAQNNIIYAQYTGNSRYPFKFTSVLNSTGLFSGRRWEFYGQVDSGGHYVIEKNKVIKFMQGSTTEPIAPEVSDFLAKNPSQALLNYSTNTFTEQNVATAVPSIYVHMNRYVLISVNGTNEEAAGNKYTHVIVFDTHLRRFGKLKIDHTFMFCFWLPNEVIGFVNKQNNTIKYLSFDIYGNATVPMVGLTADTFQGALVLGKFQYVRSRMMQIEEIEIEGPQNTVITPSPNFSVVLLPSTDGRNFDTAVPLTASYLSGGVAKYYTHKTAQNHSLLIKGAFSVNTVQLKFVPGGER